MKWLARLFASGKKAAIDLAHGVLNLVRSSAVQDLLRSTLGEIVMKVVAEVRDQMATGTSADKREAAYVRIVAQAEASGIHFSTSIVNLLIELAVQKLKVEGTS